MAKRADRLATDLLTWLIERRPGLLVGDTASVDEVSAALQEVLGAQLGWLIIKGTRAAFDRAYHKAMQRVGEAAIDIANNAIFARAEKRPAKAVAA